MFDGKAFGEMVVAAVKEHVAGIMGPLRERMATVEAKAHALEQNGTAETISALRERVATLEARGPEKGEKGEDGLGFDDLEVVHDGERGFVLRFMRDAQVKEFPFTLPIVLDRGVFKNDTAYSRGDGVTFGGSFWIAQKDTGGKPGEGDDWRLSVKRGRDARA